MTQAPLAERIEQDLRAAFDPAGLEVKDVSYKHEGHAGWKPGGGTHFEVFILSSAFSGLSRLERQRRVNAALAAYFEAGLHALQVRCQAPEEKLRS